MLVEDRAVKVLILLVVAALGATSAYAQVDLSGTWTSKLNEDLHVRGAGPTFVSYMGIPINPSAQAAALLAWTPETVNEVHRQCVPYPATYLLVGPAGMRIWPSTDSATGEVVAWQIGGFIDRAPMTIWMDGRARPSALARSTPSGYTTGVWRGATLVTTTTHMQDGYLTRNGVPISNRATLTMYLTRHGDLLSVFGVLQDPVYLSAPYALSGSFVYDATATVADPPATCTPQEEVPALNDGHIPSYLSPQANPSLMRETQEFAIPHQAALGGPETMLPEYAKQIATQYVTPSGYCKIACCGGLGDDQEFELKVLKCGLPAD